MIRDEWFERGRDNRRALFGADGTDAQIDNTTELNDKLQEVVTRWCFGDIWLREALAPRDRCMLTVAMMLALGRAHELNLHMRGALLNGVSEVELREICLHAVLYCGIPSANDGLRTLEAILRERDEPSELLSPAPTD